MGELFYLDYANLCQGTLRLKFSKRKCFTVEKLCIYGNKNSENKHNITESVFVLRHIS